jgi:2,5-diketo-D-gluconate reductase A
MVPTIHLKDGASMPQLGYGLWRVPVAEAQAATSEALAAGYRSLDTARIYENEAAVGQALRASGVPRDEVFVTTKLWNDAHGSDAARRAFDQSLSLMGLDYVDLYLIHWPAPKQDRYVETWKALLQLRKEGRVRSVGVSNFGVAHLTRLADETGEMPPINQIELHPRFAQKSLRAFHKQHGIVTEAWSPLGQGQLLDDPVIVEIAGKLGRSPAQVILRWHLDHGHVVIPKSVTPARIHENFAVFDFELDEIDRKRIDALDVPDGRIGPNPDTANF